MEISPAEGGGCGGDSVWEVMLRFFRENDWKFQQIEGKPIVRMGFAGHNGGSMCIARADEERQRMIFHSVVDGNVPVEKRQAVAEYLTMANYGTVLGNFEMDFDNGEVRYKTSIDVGDGQLTTGMVRALVQTNLLATDRYLPGIAQVMSTDAHPREVCELVEHQAYFSPFPPAVGDAPDKGGSILEVMLRFFREDDWRFEQGPTGRPVSPAKKRARRKWDLPNQSWIRFVVRGVNGDWECRARANDESRHMIFYSIKQDTVPQDRWRPVVEFLTRANHGLVIGNFDMDMWSGFVLFRTSVVVTGGQLTVGMVERLVHSNLVTFDRYLPGIEKVISSDICPAEACAEVER